MSEIQKRDLTQYQKIAVSSCNEWGLETNIELIQNGENVTYKVTSKGNNYCLRVTDEKHRSCDQLKAELDWICYLSNNGVLVAKPIELPGGSMVLTFKVNEKKYFASVFEWADGELFTSKKNLNRDFIMAYGSLVGKNHSLTKRYSSSHLFEKRKLWESSRHNVQAESLIASYNKDMVRHWLEARKWYDDLEKTKDSYGLVHMDLHTGNFHVKNNTDLKVFDFDDSAYGFYTYDIVVPLMRLFSEQNKEFDYVKIEEIFLEAYLKQNDLSQVWIDRIPSFVRLRNIEMYAWVQLMYGNKKEPRHKEYLSNIEESMLRKSKFV